MKTQCVKCDAMLQACFIGRDGLCNGCRHPELIVTAVVADETPKAHPFERTLGPGPYTFAGTFDLGACVAALHAGNVAGYNAGLASAPRVESGMGTCSHCGMAISLICIVKTGEGKLYGVGSDCILKCGLPVRELSKLEKAKKDRERMQRAARKARKGAEARAELAEIIQAEHERMSKMPHPCRRPGATELDYANWVLQHSNDGGIVIALKGIKARLLKVVMPDAVDALNAS